MFQSTPLCEGRRFIRYLLPLYEMFQSPPLCEGHPRYISMPLAPTWFHSTPLCEGRLDAVADTKQLGQFQSTPLCEGRHRLLIRITDTQTVSIHAPVRGATFSFFVDVFYEICFNPRPCARGDFEHILAIANYCRFQSTPLCEGRQTRHHCLYPHA